MNSDAHTAILRVTVWLEGECSASAELQKRLTLPFVPCAGMRLQLPVKCQDDAEQAHYASLIADSGSIVTGVFRIKDVLFDCGTHQFHLQADEVEVARGPAELRALAQQLILGYEFESTD